MNLKAVPSVSRTAVEVFARGNWPLLAQTMLERLPFYQSKVALGTSLHDREPSSRLHSPRIHLLRA